MEILGVADQGWFSEVPQTDRALSCKKARTGRGILKRVNSWV